MAQEAPVIVDMLDIQFKLHSKSTIFKVSNNLRSNVNLLAISSSRGILFAGNPNAPLLLAVIVKDLVEAKNTGQQPKARLVPLPSIPNILACSSDGNLLAINYTQNNMALLNIYSVTTFTATEVTPLYNIRLSANDYVHAFQLLWNPVLPNNLAVVLNNGALAMYNLKDCGNFELHSIDQSQQVKCACWSPKGKQIVLGFPNGKLQQFKPDLSPAKSIPCPADVHGLPFDTIAVYWLSTYQFAAIFLQHGEDCSPSLYIINAPKGGQPTYINYYDVCYSSNGPRNHQFNFTHVPQWNLLLVTSANSIEVGVLGTTESGDAPIWLQYALLDEARIELPLSEANEETFPIGFVYDTSSTHQLTVAEKQLKAMPMVHVLGTDGTLISFNFLNLKNEAASVCSPPPPVADASGQFKALRELQTTSNQVKTEHITNVDNSFTFTPNTVTSTPAPVKDKSSLFSDFNVNPAPTANSLTVAQPSVGINNILCSGSGETSATAFFGGINKPNTYPTFAAAKPAEPLANNTVQTNIINATSQSMPQSEVLSTKSANINKPLYSVPNTFKPPPTTEIAPNISNQAKLSDDEIDSVLQQIMNVQIKSFDVEIQEFQHHTQKLFSNIGNPDEIKFYTKRLNDLEEINTQAKDREIELELQNLRHSLNESYTMLEECRSKLEFYNLPDIACLKVCSTKFDAISRRQLKRLQTYLLTNETQMQIVQQHIDAQWEQYQDTIRRSSKSKMHIPCLEGIYQRLTKLRHTLSERRLKLSHIKLMLKKNGIQLHEVDRPPKVNDTTTICNDVESLTESILSISIAQTFEHSNQAKLSAEKLQLIRSAIKQQKVRTIQPQRPNRVDINSEVIIELTLKREKEEKQAKEEAAAATAAAVAATAEANRQQIKKLTKTTKSLAPTEPSTTSSSNIFTAPILMTTTKPKPTTNFSFPFTMPTTTNNTFTLTTKSIEIVTTAVKSTAATFGSFVTVTSNFNATVSTPTFSFAGMTISNPGATAPTKVLPETKVITNNENIFAGFGSNLTITKVPPITPDKDTIAPTVTPIMPFTGFSTSVGGAISVVGSGTTTAAVKDADGGKTLSFTNFATAAKPTPTTTADIGVALNFTDFGATLGSATTSNTTTWAVAKPSFSFGGALTACNAGNTITTATTSSKNDFSLPAANNVFISVTQTPTANIKMGNEIAAKAETSATVIVSSETVATTSSISTPSLSTLVVTTSAPSSFATNTSDAVSDILNTVSICKPSVKDGVGDTVPVTSAATQLYAGLSVTNNATGKIQFSDSTGAVGDASRGFFAVNNTENSSVISFGKGVVSATSTAATDTRATTTTLTTSTITPVTSSNNDSFSFSSAFNNLSVTSASTLSAMESTIIAPTSVAAPLFDTSSSAFATITNTAATATTSIFNSTATAAPVAGGSIFSVATTATALFGNASTTTAPTSDNIFGGIPKPEQSVFANASTTNQPPPAGLFASSTASNSTPFGSTAASVGNIFGGGAKTTALAKPGPFSSSGTSIFANNTGNTNTASFGGSIFAAAGSSGSIFSQNTFGQAANTAGVSGGNIFAAATTPTQQQQSIFGGGSIFGGNSGSAGNSGSMFSNSGFGSFAQSGASVAQTGFGAPQTAQQQQQNTFNKPVFGGAATFGSSTPAFGAPPTFGGAPTFGSPKSFGSFAAAAGSTASPNPFGSGTTQKNNLFETLGATDTGLSFGNLAQSGTNNTPKPAFGGSSFMNYRA